MKGTKLASDIKYYLDYAKYNEEKQAVETWEDSVKRVMNMHRNHPKFQEAFKNERFNELFNLTEQLYLDKVIIGSQRALQFGGEPIMKHNAKMFNCIFSYCDRTEFFQEAMYFLMSGCGVGYSVQYRHVNKLPNITNRNDGTKTFVVQDSIEGWADAFGVLMSSFFQGEVPFPEFQNFTVYFDYSLIRPKGAMISGGFKAPGPDGLKQSIERAEELLNKALKDNRNRLETEDCYDIVCHMADAVLSGGVRRCLPGSYEVETTTGWKNIKDIKSGEDKVLFKGEEHLIENLFIQGKQKLIKLITETGYHTSTENHKWLVYSLKNKEVIWETALEISKDLQNFSFLKEKK